MEITNELLAAYAEGNVSKEERKAVRQYLTEHPKELESVMMMMDDYYDLNFEDCKEESNKKVLIAANQSNNNICYGAAAFAPHVVPMQHIIETPRHADNESFDDRLEDFLNELGM